jgi:hypothetical protein
MNLKKKKYYLVAVVLLGLGIFLFCKKDKGTRNGNHLVDKKTKKTNKSSLTQKKVKTKSKPIKKTGMVRFKDFPNEDIKCYPNKLRVNYSLDEYVIFSKELDVFYPNKTPCDLKGKKESIELMCKKYNCVIESQKKNEFILVFKDSNDPSEVAKHIDDFNSLGKISYKAGANNQNATLICDKDLNKHNIRYLTYVGNMPTPTYLELQTKYPGYIHPKKCTKKKCIQFVNNLMTFYLFSQNSFKEHNSHLTLKDRKEKCNKFFVYKLCEKFGCKVISVNESDFMMEFNDIPLKQNYDDSRVEINKKKELILKYQLNNMVYCGKTGRVLAKPFLGKSTPTSIPRETNDNYKSYNAETAYCTYERTKYNDAFLILRYFKSQGWITLNDVDFVHWDSRVFI